MTLKHTQNASFSNRQVNINSDQDSNEKYRLLTLILEKKILKISKENMKIGARSLAVKKLIKKKSKDVEMLKNRLDKYNDNWRN